MTTYTILILLSGLVIFSYLFDMIAKKTKIPSVLLLLFLGIGLKLIVNYFSLETFDFLKILASLPEEYKTGDNRILLFKTIFEKRQLISLIKVTTKSQPYAYTGYSYSVTFTTELAPITASGFALINSKNCL